MLTKEEKANMHELGATLPPEEKDETFEIISEKEKIWKDFLVEAETNYIKSEASMLQNESMIELAKVEIKKEAKKNELKPNSNA